MKVTVFGTGYVGLVQAAVLAEVGHEVACIDIDAARIARLTQGDVPIFEPGLAELVVRNLADRRLQFSTDAQFGVAFGKVIFIAVGTPPDEDGAADLSHVLAVARTVGQHMTARRDVVIKSTVPVGTGDRVRAAIAAELATAGRAVDFAVISNPEFLKEGSAVNDCMRPDRIIVGVRHRDDADVLRELYAPFNRNHEKMIVMDVRSAELTKYAANAFLATKISFMNEIANLADRVGADVEWVRKGIGADPRIGSHFIYPGIGYGGSCFPKDVQALIRTAEQVGAPNDILRAVEARNANQKRVLVDKILAHFRGDIAGRTFALWGLAFKPNTDDMREAPSRVIMEDLWAHGARIRAFDPAAMDECRRLYGERDDLILATDREDALAGADALVIATEWRAFQAVDYEALAGTLSGKAIFDGRNVLHPEGARAAGLTYYGVGRDRETR